MKLYRKDIAKIAGVSAQTVSYVLNGSRNFSQETVEKVMDAVQKTGYKPDAIAKGLAKKHLNIVAILIDNFSNPVYSEIMDGFQQEAYKSGYVVVVADLKNRGENIIADLVSMRVAGIYITLGMMETCVKLLAELENNDIKVVFGNKIENNGRQYVFVETDKRRIMHDAVQYLADCGHENIVYFSGLDIRSTSDERCMGFQKAYDTMGNAVNLCLTYVNVFDFDAFWQKYCNHLKNRDYKIELVSIDVNEMLPYSEIRVAKATHLRSGKLTYLYHIAVHFC